FFSSRRRHTRFSRDWSSDVCSSDLRALLPAPPGSGEDLRKLLSLQGQGPAARIPLISPGHARHLPSHAAVHPVEGDAGVRGGVAASVVLTRLLGIPRLHAQAEGPVEVEDQEAIRRTLAATEPGAQDRCATRVVLEPGREPRAVERLALGVEDDVGDAGRGGGILGRVDLEDVEGHVRTGHRWVEPDRLQTAAVSDGEALRALGSFERELPRPTELLEGRVVEPVAGVDPDLVDLHRVLEPEGEAILEVVAGPGAPRGELTSIQQVQRLVERGAGALFEVAGRLRKADGRRGGR